MTNQDGREEHKGAQRDIARRFYSHPNPAAKRIEYQQDEVPEVRGPRHSFGIRKNGRTARYGYCEKRVSTNRALILERDRSFQHHRLLDPSRDGPIALESTA